EVVSIWSSSLLASPSNGAVWTVNFTALCSTLAVAGYSPDNGASPARTPDVIPQPASGTNVTSPWSFTTSPALTVSSYRTLALTTGNTTDIRMTSANTAIVGAMVRRSTPNKR